MSTTAFPDTVARALEILRADHPRAIYAAAVIRGRQRWSGADLQGDAKRWSSYGKGRRHAAAAWAAAGGEVLALRRSGMLVSVVRVGTDDHGAALYQTDHDVLGPDAFRR